MVHQDDYPAAQDCDLQSSVRLSPRGSLLTQLCSENKIIYFILFIRTTASVAVKVTPDLRGCPPGKYSYARHFKGKHGKLYIVGKVNGCRFAGFFNPTKENRKQPQNDHVLLN